MGDWFNSDRSELFCQKMKDYIDNYIKYNTTMEELKKQAIEKIEGATGGFFLLTYDEDGFCEMLEGIGDNKAAYKASKLSDLLSDARIKYANWRTKEGKN